MRELVFSRRECEFEDDCDSLAWEETEETLLLWEDFPGYSLGPDNQAEACTHLKISVVSKEVGKRTFYCRFYKLQFYNYKRTFFYIYI